MALDVNQTRMRDSKILLVIALATAIFSKPFVTPESGLSAIMEVSGFVMIAVCALGRIYSTLFIGGVKSDKLVTTGAYSLCRNPLYFFSLVGVAGIGMMSEELTLLVFLTTAFSVLYYRLILREEQFLAQKFGSDFTAFCASTPRLLPDISKFSTPEEVTFRTVYLHKAIRDAAWWFMAMPVFEILEYLHDKGIIKPLFSLL